MVWFNNTKRFFGSITGS